MTLRGGLELVTEMANLLLQGGYKTGILCGLNHLGRNDERLGGKSEAKEVIVSWLDPNL